jgi:hypothetical protein
MWEDEVLGSVSFCHLPNLARDRRAVFKLNEILLLTWYIFFTSNPHSVSCVRGTICGYSCRFALCSVPEGVCSWSQARLFTICS